MCECVNVKLTCDSSYCLKPQKNFYSHRPSKIGKDFSSRQMLGELTEHFGKNPVFYYKQFPEIYVSKFFDKAEWLYLWSILIYSIGRNVPRTFVKTLINLWVFTQ